MVRQLKAVAVASVCALLLLSGCSKGREMVSKTVDSTHTAQRQTSEVLKSLLTSGSIGNVVSVTVQDDRDITAKVSKTTSDRTLIEALLERLQQASFVGDNRMVVNVKWEGYLVFLTLADGSKTTLTYWPGEGTPNLRDMGMQEWWMAKGIDEVMHPLLPTNR